MNKEVFKIFHENYNFTKQKFQIYRRLLFLKQNFFKNVQFEDTKFCHLYFETLNSKQLLLKKK